MKTEIYAGAGKSEVELRRITEMANSPIAAILAEFRGPRGLVYLATRTEVEAGDITRLAASYGHPASRRRISHIHGRTSFTIAGYEHDDRELFEIPEVRRFYALTFRSCPVLLHAADLRNECLRIAVLCVISNLTVIRRAQWQPEVQVDSRELERFFMEHLRRQAALHKMLGWSRQLGKERLQILADYLGIRAP